MVMSGALPISATNTHAAPRGTAAAANRKPLTAATNGSRSRLSLTEHRLWDSPGGRGLSLGRRVMSSQRYCATDDSDVTLIVQNWASRHSAAVVISIGEDIITGAGDSEEDGVGGTTSPRAQQLSRQAV